VLTVSDRASAGEYEDLSGPEVRACLEEHAQQHDGWTLDITSSSVVPDDQNAIEDVLLQWSAQASPNGRPHCNLVLTTGGTGFAPRDVTPEDQ